MLTTSPRRLRSAPDMTAAWRHIDFSLVALVAVTSCFGALMVFSATRGKESGLGFVSKQLAFIALGTVVMGITAALDYQRLRDWARVLYVGTVAMLAAVLRYGQEHRNIKAWFDIGPIQIQPAELAKIGLIVTVAAYLGTLPTTPKIRHVVVSLAMLGIPMGLILLQPDLGTMLVFACIGAGLLVVGQVPGRILAVLVLGTILAVLVVLKAGVLDQYQIDRLTAFAHPETAPRKLTYNTDRAQDAISSGGLTGQGLFNGPQTKGGFVPVQESDFIFTVPGEELGFIGAAGLLALLGGICFRVWRTAYLARDPVGRLICVGVLCMLVFHIFENVGMGLGIMPVTGIPLPFVSYGGSSTLAMFAGMGLVLNVHMRRFS